MTDGAFYEAPEHLWGPLWRFQSKSGWYILTPQGRLLRLHTWVFWYAWYKWEHQRWMHRRRR